MLGNFWQFLVVFFFICLVTLGAEHLVSSFFPEKMSLQIVFFVRVQKNVCVQKNYFLNPHFFSLENRIEGKQK
jgi:hypothetical protein